MSTAVMEPRTGYEISITRTFDAPRELVWKAWTDPKMAKAWMGPRGFTTTEFTTSDEAGSPWHLTMVGQRPGSDQMVTLGQGGRDSRDQAAGAAEVHVRLGQPRERGTCRRAKGKRHHDPA